MPRRLRWGHLAVLLCALPSAGCYSLSQLRLDQVVRTSDDAVTLGVWFMARGCPMSGGDAPVAEAVTAILFYPLDVLLSSVVAARAPFDPRLDITWGPVGAVAGIALPWVTLIPHLYPPLCVLRPAPEVSLSASDFANLVDRVRGGDGLSAYRQLVGSELSACPGEVIVSVVLVDGYDAGQPNSHKAPGCQER